jgi:hypothetical protein
MLITVRLHSKPMGIVFETFPATTTAHAQTFVKNTRPGFIGPFCVVQGDELLAINDDAFREHSGTEQDAVCYFTHVSLCHDHQHSNC